MICALVLAQTVRHSAVWRYDRNGTAAARSGSSTCTCTCTYTAVGAFCVISPMLHLILLHQVGTRFGERVLLFRFFVVVVVVIVVLISVVHRQGMIEIVIDS